MMKWHAGTVKESSYVKILSKATSAMAMKLDPFLISLEYSYGCKSIPAPAKMMST